MKNEGVMLLSIIIPAFNIGNYISDCLNSFIGERYSNLEVIVVNDGSIDNTGITADKYVSNYEHIHIIHQPNLGVSEARNIGLLNSTGEYIWFVDGDDIVQNVSAILEVCEKCLNDETDLILFKLKEFQSEENIEINSLETVPIKSLIFRDNFRKMLINNEMSYFVFDKIIKKSIMINGGVYFPNDYNISEDFIWNCNVLPLIKNYCVLNEVFYIHRINRVYSATYELTDSKVYTILRAIYENIESIEGTYKLSDQDRISFFLYISRVWFYILPETYSYSRSLFLKTESDFIRIYSIFGKYKLPLDELNRGANLLKIFIKLVGLKFGLRFYATAIALKRKKLTLSKYK